MIEVKPVPAFNDNYIWLIIQTDNKHTAIVDPGDAAPVLERLENDKLVPAAILITHHHFDHVGGIDGILSKFNIPVYGPRDEKIPQRTHALVDGDNVDLGDMDIRFNIMDMPGHTSGAIAYHAQDIVFVGDTLFMAGCGRLFEGTPAQMHDSLGKLAQLPENTQVYCAHEYTLANLKFAESVEPDNQDIKDRIERSNELRNKNIPTVPGSIATEKLTNPFLRSHVAEVIEAANNYRGQKLTNEIDVFAAIRNWKDNF